MDDERSFPTAYVAWDIVREDRRQPSGLGEALLRTPPAPCNDCEYRQRCAEELLACWAFRKFVSRNPKIEEERVPKRYHYEAVFSGVDDEIEASDIGGTRPLSPPVPGSRRLTGAYPHLRGRWMSRISVDAQDHYLGLFDTEEEAHEAYVAAKKRVKAGLPPKEAA